MNEERELRALIADAWPHCGRPALRAHAERIVEWHELRALAQVDLHGMRTAALSAIETELRRRVEVDELVALLRRTASTRAKRAA